MNWVALAAVGGSTTVGIAGVVASILSSKRQTTATLAGIAAERERQAAAHAEDHLRNRQTTYHLFLTAATRLRALPPQPSEESLTDEELKAAEQMRWEFVHLLNGVELFGTDPVRRAAGRVDAALGRAAASRGVQIFEAPPGYVDASARASIEAIVRLLRQGEVADRMDDLMDAMRADVAPDDGKTLESSGGEQRQIAEDEDEAETASSSDSETGGD